MFVIILLYLQTSFIHEKNGYVCMLVCACMFVLMVCMCTWCVCWGVGVYICVMGISSCLSLKYKEHSIKMAMYVTNAVFF